LKHRDFSKIAFVVSAALLAFGYGVAVGRYQIFPYGAIKFGYDAIALVFDEREMIAKIRPTKHLLKARESEASGLPHSSW